MHPAHTHRIAIAASVPVNSPVMLTVGANHTVTAGRVCRTAVRRELVRCRASRPTGHPRDWDLRPLKVEAVSGLQGRTRVII